MKILATRFIAPAILGCALVLLHTDGVASRWPSAPLVALLPRNPTLLAAALAWTHTRGRDDTTVVVLKQEEPA